MSKQKFQVKQLLRNMAHCKRIVALLLTTAILLSPTSLPQLALATEGEQDIVEVATVEVSNDDNANSATQSSGTETDSESGESQIATPEPTEPKNDQDTDETTTTDPVDGTTTTDPVDGTTTTDPADETTTTDPVDGTTTTDPVDGTTTTDPDEVMDEAVADEEISIISYTEADGAYGDFSITMPTNDTDATYTLQITLLRTVVGGTQQGLTTTENYLVTVDDEDHAIALSVNADYNAWGTLYGELTNIPSGATVTAKDILVTTGDGSVWDDYEGTTITLAIISTDSTETVTVAEGTQSLTTNDITAFTAQSATEEPTVDDGTIYNTTTETFLNRADSADDGVYSILYMLNNYNVVSYNDIESTHIVGPIIAQNSAYYTDQDDILKASDYSRGVSSYVGTPLSYYDNAGEIHASFKLSYAFDPEYNGYFTIELPDLFVGSTDLTVTEVVENWNPLNYITLGSTDETFLAPNNGGQVYYTAYENGSYPSKEMHTYQNLEEDFIDFAELWDALTQDSYDLLETGYLEEISGEVIVIDVAPAYLEIDAGNSYLIKDATQLETVNITLPDGFDFFNNPYLPPTVVNFEGTSINPTTINGHVVSQFPATLINGVELTAEEKLNSEYSEIGNKLVWNLPNVVTTGNENRLVTFASSPNIAGHIVAVNAEFWNYDASGNWEGGNLNGTAIFKDFHSGETEMHMWAYGGYEELSTYVNLSVEKIFTNGDLSSHSFQFELTPANEAAEGLEDIYTFPLKTTTNDSGNAIFSALVFDDEDTYSFYVEEVIPEGADDTIVYDTTRYLVTIDVSVSSDVDESGMTTSTYSHKITYETVGADGVAIATADVLVFTNIQNTLDSLSYSLTKVDGNGHPLAGATFQLTTVDPATDETAWDNAADQMSTADGTITFGELDTTITYYFRESNAPTGYDALEGYWQLNIDEFGMTTVVAIGGAPDITSNQVINYLSETALIEVTLFKQNARGSGLSGAVFQVEELYSFAKHIVVENGYSATVTSSTTGNLTITNLELDKVYKLSEIAFPSGYTLPSNVNYWLLELVTDDTAELGYTVTFYEVNLTDTLTTVIDREDFVLMNEDSYTLPETGGMGTAYYSVIGLLMMIGAGYILNKKIFIKKEWR